MRIKLCLTRFPGAEMIEHKGEYGVFIPQSYNGRMVKNTKAATKPNMVCELFGLTNKLRKRKGYLESFVVIPPKEARDTLLGTKGLFSFEKSVAWSFHTKSEKDSSPVSSSDFEEMLNL